MSRGIDIRGIGAKGRGEGERADAPRRRGEAIGIADDLGSGSALPKGDLLGGGYLSVDYLPDRLQWRVPRTVFDFRK